MQARAVVVALLLALPPGALGAQTGSVQIPPAPRGFSQTQADVVVDQANVLSPEAEDQLDRIAFDVHAKSGGVITVLTLPDIGDRAPDDIALAAGRAWKVGENAAIGQRSRNAGTVVLIVPKETSSTGHGACRVETGQGSEAFITDADAGAICRAATPLFIQKDYSGATLQVVAQVAQHYAQEFNFQLDTALANAAPPIEEAPEPAPARAQRGGGGGILGSLLLFFLRNPIFLLVLIFVVLPALFGGRRRRGGCGGGGCLPIFIPGGFGGGYRGGGFGGGGGWGGGGGGGFGGLGGGGGFSGGGGGSSW